MDARQILIVSHRVSGNMERLTDAVFQGASAPGIRGIEVRSSIPFQTGPRDVLQADALILGTTENFGYMSGALKDFFDRIYYPCLESTRSLPYALFIRAGNDGRGARSSVQRIVSGLGWKPVQTPLICRGVWDEAFLAQCEELGMTVAAGMEAGIF
jgi:multimeric flavodoxin WrbA